MVLALTAQQTQYKLLYVNFLFWLQYSVFGVVNFRVAALFCNLFLLPVIFLLWRLFLPRQQDFTARLLLFVPISFIWFQLNYAETVDWALAGYQTLPVLSAVLLAVLLLLRGTRSAMAGATVCLAAAMFSSGSGFILPIVGGLLLLRRRRLVHLAVWSGMTLAYLTLYLCRYTLVRLQPPNPLPFLAENFRRLTFAVAFLGDATGYLVPSLLLGVALCIFWIHMLRKGYLHRRPELGYFVLFIGLVSLLTAFGRAEGGVKTALFSRYRLHSDLLLAFTWMAIADEYLPADPWQALRSPIVRCALPLAVVFAMVMDGYGVRWIGRRDAWLRSGVAAWEHPQKPLQNVVQQEPGQPPQGAAWDAWDRHATSAMEHAVSLGIYHPPALPQ